MSTFTLLGLVACTIGSLCIYLASPNQRWLGEAWPAPRARLARWAGALLCLLAWFAFAVDMQRLAASFMWVTTLMWLLALLPYVGAWRALRRGG